MDLKIYAYLAILAAIIAAFSATYKAGVENGYNKNVAEVANAAKERIEEVEKQSKVDIENANKVADNFKNQLIQLQLNKPKEVTVYVDRISKNPANCKRIAGFSELWNASRANYQ